MLAKIKLTPGINRDTTQYTNTGGWYDSDFIRFRNGLPEKIGGWQKVYANQTALVGTCRKMVDWSSLVGAEYLAIPTDIKFYVDNSTQILDITPLRREVTLTANAIATTNTSHTITITDINHNAKIGNYITISGATTTNGISNTDINKEFVVSGLVNANAYTVLTSGTATSTGDGGGSSISVAYQFYPGTTTTSIFAGWGAGVWGGSNIAPMYGWGYGPDTTITSSYSGLWTVDNYGQDMVACPRDLTNGVSIGSNAIATSNASNVVTVTQVNHGYSNNQAIIIGGITDSEIGGVLKNDINGTHIITVANANAYTFTVASNATSSTSGGSSVYAYISSLIYWAIPSANNTSNAVSFSALGAAYAKKFMPYVATEIMVSDTDRRVIAFGTNPFDVSQGQDKMVVRWSDSKDPTNWDTSDTTTDSGEQRLSSGAFIVTAVQNREEILIWTDNALYTMTNSGSPYWYSFQLVGTNFDIIGPNSKMVTGSVAYWMGSNNFYQYDGKVAPMPCTVRDYVFEDIDRENGYKVYCSADSGNNEIIWFYPSLENNDGEINRYVVFNYVENVWYYGTLSRTSWIDRRGHPYPRAMSADGYLYSHENGEDDGSVVPAVPIPAYIESSPFEINDGQSYAFINRVIPDMTFRNSTTNNGNEPSVTFTIKPQNYPGGLTGAGDARTVTRNSASTFTLNRYTDQVFTRIRARSVSIKIESDVTGISWRFGTPRLDMRQDGRK